jgi:hypothetical protein
MRSLDLAVKERRPISGGFDPSQFDFGFGDTHENCLRQVERFGGVILSEFMTAGLRSCDRRIRIPGIGRRAISWMFPTP